MICIADADRASDCCKSVNKPALVEDTNQWIKTANDQWTTELRGFTTLDSEHVHGRFFRWSKESVLTASYDNKEVLAKLGVTDTKRLDLFLDRCRPTNPIDVKDSDFIHEFRNPQSCLKDGFQNAKITCPKKNSQIIDDAIDKASKVNLEKLLARLPDLRMLSEFIISLDKQV